MVAVGSLLGDHVDGGAFGAAVFSGEALGADLKFLDGFERQLHHRIAEGVVFVVNTVHGDVDVTAAGTVDGEDGVAVLVGVVGVGGFDAGREIGEVGHVAAENGKCWTSVGVISC